MADSLHDQMNHPIKTNGNVDVVTERWLFFPKYKFFHYPHDYMLHVFHQTYDRTKMTAISNELV